VLSHLRTPNCSVADAVIASSAIPFAFASRVLEVKGAAGAAWHHTIVDGGVWSNFPMYVFEDAAFRDSYSRGASASVETDPVLGFLLDEGLEQQLPYGDQVRFVGPELGEQLQASEWRPAPASTPPRSLGGRLCAALLYPFSLLGRFANWNGGVDPGRWPRPASKVPRYLVDSLDGLLGGIYVPLVALVPCVVVAVGSWAVGGYFVADQLAVFPETDWSDPMAWLGRLFGLGIAALGLSVAILVFFGALLTVAANRLLLRTLRRIFYGLAATYVAGSGAPAWAAEKKNVIALPIPAGVGTLSFDMEPAQRERLVDGANAATRSKLDELLDDARGIAKLEVPAGAAIDPGALAAGGAQDTSSAQIDRP
jgi:hypothetical protein